VEDLKKELQITRQQPTHTENYEVMIADLTSQLQEMKLKVRDYENRANQQLMISQVQQEITDIKKQHAASMVKGGCCFSHSVFCSCYVVICAPLCIH